MRAAPDEVAPPYWAIVAGTCFRYSSMAAASVAVTSAIT